MEPDRYLRITLRIPRELHAKLEAEATRTSKSQNAEIVTRLEQSFEGRPVWDEFVAAEQLESRNVLRLRIERLVQQCGTLGEDVRLLQALIQEGGVKLDPETTSYMVRSAKEAEAAVLAARAAIPDQAIEDLKAAVARFKEVRDRIAHSGADKVIIPQTPEAPAPPASKGPQRSPNARARAPTKGR